VINLTIKKKQNLESGRIEAGYVGYALTCESLM